MPNQPLPPLQVVAIRYFSDRPTGDEEGVVAAYAASRAYEAVGVDYEIVEPQFPEAERTEDAPYNLGLLGGAIADVVAEARRKGQAVLMTGGNCSHATGLLGGLQDAHGADARVGLVWFDAHGDYNTPHTTLTGRLGGMPVAVCAGLALPRWRETSHISAPLPTDRIVLVDVRNLDSPEAALINATETVIAAPAPGFPGVDLEVAVADLASRVDMLYLHVDADVLDAAYVPNHWTVEPNGPTMAQVLAAVDTVMATGKVVASALVSVRAEGDGAETSVASGIELLRGMLISWHRHGAPGLTPPAPSVGTGRRPV
ncbi:MAG: arginase family protein [Anaerolineae bacterium]